MPSLAKKKTHQNGKALVCFFAKKGGKKRGRKEILRQKDHGHGHRNLSVYRLQIIFEYGITKLKTKNDKIVNDPIEWILGSPRVLIQKPF